MLATAIGGAGVGLVAADTPRASASYHAGPPDWVDASLNVQGDLTVTGKMGIGRSIPAQGSLDVAGAIYVNGAIAINSSGVAMQSYYMAVAPPPTTFDPGEWGVVRQYNWGDLTSNSWTWAALQSLTAP